MSRLPPEVHPITYGTQRARLLTITITYDYASDYLHKHNVPERNPSKKSEKGP